MTAAGRLSRPDRDERRKRRVLVKRARRRLTVEPDRRARARTGIRAARSEQVYQAPARVLPESAATRAGGELRSPRNCYVCKDEFTRLHFFYDSMCGPCGDFNYDKRFQTAPLHGRVALITGARTKIGFRASLMMLRAGARVAATTRFPVDAAARYRAESDFERWGDRLQIYGLDLRHTPSVELFARRFAREHDRLDLLINNAAQTVRRPPGFYTHMMADELRPWSEQPERTRSLLAAHHECTAEIARLSGDGAAAESELPVAWNGPRPGIGLSASARLSQVPYREGDALVIDEVFPRGELDADLQQVDLRENNSWRLRLGEVEPSELLEVQLVNAIAPFVLCNRLLPLMRRHQTGEKHIVNVTAMEGKFHRFKKADRHPHTNMAKAALNMMTHTGASSLAADGIFMNAVDTGWVTDEDPAELAQLKRTTHDFEPQLDIVDGAARVCDPFFDGILRGEHWCGRFLKDYRPIDW